jgi:uncharacterized protein involved in exopolysaccharide biosynthesis
MEEEINLLDYYKVIKKRWKIIFYIFIISVISTIVVSFKLPKIYQAKSVIFVQGGTGGISSLVANLPIPVDISGITGGGSSDYLVALLKSENLREKIIKKIKLDKNKFFVDPKEKITREKILKKLQDSTKIQDDKKGTITIIVETKNPSLSAEIANCYVDVLRGSIHTQATENREFIEKQLKNTKEKLKIAEENLKKFQEKNKIISTDKEVEKLIENYAELQSQKTANEISLRETEALLKSTGNISDLMKLEAEKVSLQTRVREINNAISQLENEFLKIPEKGLELARLLREVKVQNTIFEMLTQQYELAKINEQKEDIKFQVIDRAYPPEKHIKPNKKINVMLSAVVSLFIGIFIAFFLEYLENIKEEEAKI